MNTIITVSGFISELNNSYKMEFMLCLNIISYKYYILYYKCISII